MIIMPNTVMAKANITEIKLTINPITSGNQMSTTARIESVSPEGALKIDEMPLNWSMSDSSDGSGETAASGYFQTGKYYMWSLNVYWDSILNDGYGFDEMTTSIVFNDGIEWEYTQATDPVHTNISKISMKIDPIVAGKTMPSTIEVESVSPAYAIKTTTVPITWEVSDNADGSGSTTASGKFIEGKYYMWLISWDAFLNTAFYIGDFSTIVEFNNGNTDWDWTKAEKPTQITEFRLYGDEIKEGNTIPTVATVETVPANGVEKTSINLVWYKSSTGTELWSDLTSGMKTTGNFEIGKYYYVGTKSGLTLKADFELASSYKVYYNDVEIGSWSSTSISINWIEIFEEVTIENYTYKFISGDNQELTMSKIDKFTFRIDGDYSLFEELKVGNFALVKDIDYTVTEGSTIITFTETGLTKLNTLVAGIYDVTVKYTDNTVTGKLIVKEETKQEENNITNTENTNIVEDNNTTNTIVENKTNNPKTGDTIMLVVAGLVLSVAGIYVTKKKLVK